MSTIVIVSAVAAQEEFLRDCLRSSHTVVTATDGAAGVALAEQTDPDLMFMALALPGMDGAEAIRRLKAQPRLRDTPVIALITPDMPEQEAQAWAAGCEDVLHTPFDEDEVADAVRKWLGGG